MNKSKQTLEELVNHYDYDLENLTGKPGYEHRKGKILGLRYRRIKRIICAYATESQIKNFLATIENRDINGEIKK